jgi:hypothetical protein
MKPRSRNLLIASLVAMMASLLFFPDRLALEPEMSVSWFQPSAILPTLPGLRDGESAIGLYTADSVAFIGSSGERASLLSTPEASSLTGGRLARLDSLNRQVEILDAQADVVARLSGIGAPYFSGQSLAVVGQGASSLQVFTDSGESRWRYDGPDLLTGFCSTKSGDSFLAFAGGTISWRDPLGGERLSWRPGIGRVPVVYSMLWVESRQLLAVVADLYPQTLVLVRPRLSAAKVASIDLVETVTLTGASRNPIWMQAGLGDSVVVIEQQDGIGVLFLDSPARTVIPLGGHPERVLSLDDAGVLVCLLSSSTGDQLVGIKADGRLLFRQASPRRAYDLDLDSRGNILLSSWGGISSLGFGVR